MIISIGGQPGAGKTTVGKLLAQKLGFEFYDMGLLRRKAAEDKGMTLEAYNEYGITHPETDHDVDNYQKKLGETSDNFVIQGRTSYHFVPNSIKVFLTVEKHEGVRRIMGDTAHSRTSEVNTSIHEEMLKNITKRQESDRLRYETLYHINPLNLAQYDLVIDTTNLTIEKTLQKITAFLDENKKK